jgi:hypothetical protein
VSAPRTLLVFGAPDDPRRAEQLAALRADPAGARDRDVLVVDVADRPDAPALRAFYDVRDPFCVVLVGRDGAERARWTTVAATAELWAAVDGSPLRRAEALGEFDV